MPAYNAEKYIAQAIESLLAQSFPDWELVIVNDGSTDRTAEIIARFADPRVRVYHQLNGGEASARNTALEQMRGKYSAFLDADDLYLPEHLELALTFFQTHPEYDACYSDGHYIDETGKWLKPLSSHRRGPFEGDIFEEMVRASDVLGTPVCAVLKSDVIARYGLRFDKDIIIGPDWDFFIRYAEVAKFGHLPESTCLYRIHQTNISFRTNSKTRLLSLAKCREKMIMLKRFKGCSLMTQTFVFYDLLVNLLTGFPDRQSQVTQWQEFQALPTHARAKLFRLMACKAILADEKSPTIGEWLLQSSKLNSTDLKSIALNIVYSLAPSLCTRLVKIKSSLHRQAPPLSPLNNLSQAG